MGWMVSGGRAVSSLECTQRDQLRRNTKMRYDGCSCGSQRTPVDFSFVFFLPVFSISEDWYSFWNMCLLMFLWATQKFLARDLKASATFATDTHGSYNRIAVWSGSRKLRWAFRVLMPLEGRVHISTSHVLWIERPLHLDGRVIVDSQVGIFGWFWTCNVEQEVLLLNCGQ